MACFNLNKRITCFIFALLIFTAGSNFCALFDSSNGQLIAASSKKGKTMIDLKSIAPDSDDLYLECKKAIKSDRLYKEVFDVLHPWTLRPDNRSRYLPEGIDLVCDCLANLNRLEETDSYLETIIKIHGTNWRALQTAAQKHLSNTWGVLRDGKFFRGSYSGERVYSTQRDRVRAIQIMLKAENLLQKDFEGNKADTSDLHKFYSIFADLFVQYEYWKYQILTDLSKLPDYQSEEMNFRSRGSNYAPVDEQGNPVFYPLPKNFKSAKNDGERYRFLLDKAAKAAPEWNDWGLFQQVHFLQNQFSVQTLRSYQFFFPRSENQHEEQGSETGIWALHTLTDQETIARLANGIKRFDLPDEYNPIVLLKKILDSTNLESRKTARFQLAQIYLNRRQYVKAANIYREILSPNGDHRGGSHFDKVQYEQIVGNWGQFEPAKDFAHNTKAEIFWRFRNGRSVSLTAHRIRIPELISDIQSYIRSFENQEEKTPQWNRMQISQIGYKLVNNPEEREKYLAEKIKEWTIALEPKNDHFDDRIPIDLPFSKAGAYLIEAQMKNGNRDAVVVWINDTAIVEKRLKDDVLYFVADAKTGQPVPNLDLKFFGFGQVEKKAQFFGSRRSRKMIFQTEDFSRKTDKNGLITVPQKTYSNPGGSSLNWLVSVNSKNENSGEKRFGFLGFKNYWFGLPFIPDLQEARAFFMSDKPVYRPGQNVDFKFWIGSTRYDLPLKWDWTKKKAHFKLSDPMGNIVLEKTVQLDAWGGYSESFPIPKDAKLGQWSIGVFNEKEKSRLGTGNFSIEEYKKPEYEVLVDAPKDPVQLGDSFKVDISAKYYFGAPVAEGKVKYTVYRTATSTAWYPVRPWDWFYGNGYGWLIPDADWYPGWKIWGTRTPIPFWIPRSFTPPEIVAENEVEIGKEGKISVEIDSSSAKVLFPNEDQQYKIIAEVVDQSRRTIVGSANVNVSRSPFKIYVHTNRGYYRPNDQIRTTVNARRADGKPVSGNAVLKVFKVLYQSNENEIIPVEKIVHTASVKLDEEGKGTISFSAGNGGQYRLSASLTDSKGRTVEGGSLLSVHGNGNSNQKDSFRFNQLELITEKAEYVPGEKVRILVNTDKADSTVLLFVRTDKGVSSKPEILRLNGQTGIYEFEIKTADMPNIFVEGLVVSEGKPFSLQKEIVVPPENRMLDIAVQPSKDQYRPGEKAKAMITVSDSNGKPVSGQVVVAIYDRSLEYIVGGSNIGDIKDLFWKWRRYSTPGFESNLEKLFSHITKNGEDPMRSLGIFGGVQSIIAKNSNGTRSRRMFKAAGARAMDGDQLEMEAVEDAMPLAAAAPMVMESNEAMESDAMMSDAAMEMPMDMETKPAPVPSAEEEAALINPAIRKNFADTALWAANLQTNKKGEVPIDLQMPENLTTWKIRVWSIASGSRVGEGSSEIITGKNLIIRMQKPRFLVQKDEVFLTANIHNYLTSEKEVQVELEFPKEESFISPIDKDLTRKVKIPAQGEQRIDWRVRADHIGSATIRMKALTDEESDAVEETIPILVHGFPKQEAISGMIPSGQKETTFRFNIPKERRPEESRLTIRFSPSLAGSMFDALPYLIDYPYGCTEQTLNRFLPLLIVQNLLLENGIDLADLREKRTNLNSQEMGDPANRAKQWKTKLASSEAVFNQKIVRELSKEGADKLLRMQCADGGWGWFSGYAEHSSPYLTALVLHGLIIADRLDVGVDSGTLTRGKNWLSNYLREESLKIFRGKIWSDKKKKERPEAWKSHADDLDALVYSVLTEFDLKGKNDLAFPQKEKDFTVWSNERENSLSYMQKELWDARSQISYYSASLFALALCNEGLENHRDQIEGIVRMLSQFLKQDEENQTAWLDLSGSRSWYWRWYANDLETQAHYLKLLVRLDPKGSIAPRLVKYLLTNRKNGSHWNSTRDTAYCIEAFSDYLKITGELDAKTSVDLIVGGKILKTVKITPENLFAIDNTLILSGDELATGPCEITIRQTGNGPIYFNAWMENFTLEDPILKTGLELKAERRYYRLEKDRNAKENVAGGRGQAASIAVEKYKKIPLKDHDKIQSGDLIEVELLLESKNDYDSILIEDMKPAGFEPVDLRSGYTNNTLGAYVEYRDERVCFFVFGLNQGKHSVSYRLRAEQPGQFSALPAKIWGMYAPELKGNADEFKIQIQ
ncbi:MAG: MG2 domain-containing protein [Planctomycetia bacterium]|nr:MG2 domain-containing protein [Planctomycetia bacterium]